MTRRGCGRTGETRLRGVVLGALLALLVASPPGLGLADAPPQAPLPPPRVPVTVTRAPEPLRVPIPVPAPEPPVITGAALRRQLGLTGVSGWLLSDLETGERLDASAAETAFVPASVAKLPTALFALDTLGAAHRFETALYALGPISGGVLQGDLMLVGGGDPELDTDALEPFVAAIAAAGITRVAGRLLVDAGDAIRVSEIDPSQPVDVAYNPSVSALNLNFNRVFLRWAGAGDVELTAKAQRLAPPVESVRAVVAPQSAEPFAHRAVAGAEVWRLARQVLRGRGSRWLPVKNPEIYAGDVLRMLARGRGIRIGPPEVVVPGAGVARAETRLLARRLSRPLAEVVTDMLKFSTNLTAEVVGTVAARRLGGRPTTLAQSAEAMNVWARSLIGAEPDHRGIGFVNHSGLSVESRVAPAEMVALLRLAAGEAATGSGGLGPAAALLKSFSVAVEDDPLDTAAMEIRAKTGTMDRIRGLAGYISTPGGRRLAFAIFSNDLAARGRARRGIDRGWMRRARAFERALIREWVRAADADTPKPAATAAALSR